MGKQKIKWQTPPKSEPKVHPVMAEVAKRPGEWALVETVEAGQIVDYHDACVNHPHYELTMTPQDPEKPYECLWDVYVRYVDHGHDFQMEGVVEE